MFELKNKENKEKKTLNGSRSLGGVWGGGGEEKYLINLLNTFHVQILWVNFKDHA